MQEKTLCILLAGGVGSLLYPLTANRAKPAVPFGGRYRIIDFTLSNCLQSGLRRILVLIQYKSYSPQRHLRGGWSIFNSGLNEYIMPVPPQMRTGESWYVGTADAIYQNLYLLEQSGAELVLILSGDHIYRMDYAAMLKYHGDNEADIKFDLLFENQRHLHLHTVIPDLAFPVGNSWFIFERILPAAALSPIPKLAIWHSSKPNWNADSRRYARAKIDEALRMP